MSLSISGAVSGLDTAGIIDQLVAVEGRQQQMIAAKQDLAKKAASAYSTLMTSLTSMSSKASELAKTSSWLGTKVTSSSTAVTATSTGTVGGSLTFSVTSLAASHAVVSSGTFAGTGTVVTSGSSLRLTSGAKTTTVDVGGGTLAEVVAAVNKSDSGVRASAVQVGVGQYKLQFTAAKSGAAAAFTIGTGDLSVPTDVLTQGADATIRVGSGTAAYTVASATNTFSNVLAGASFSVSKLENDVSVVATVDGSTVADKVSALVDAANSILSSIDANTAYDQTTKSGAALFGESAPDRVRSAILSLVGGSTTPGVETTRSGRLQFDRKAFMDAFSADPDAVAEKFGTTVSMTGSTATASLYSVGKGTTSGTYAVSLTAVPVKEAWSVALPADLADAEGQTLTVARGKTKVSYVVPAGATAASVAAAFGAQLSASGLGVSAALDGGGALTLTAKNPGVGGAFTADLLDTGLASVGAATRTATGTDIAGTIDGQKASGSGDILSLPKGKGGAVGLAIHVDASTTGSVGSVVVKNGLAQALATLVDDAAGREGYLQTAKDGRNRVNDDLQEQYDKWTTRLERRRAQLTRQFTTMETTLGSLKSQLSSLSGLG